MDLFNATLQVELLPFDGSAIYYGPIFSIGESRQYYDYLLEQIEWRQDEAYFFGKHIITKRKVAWYGTEPFAYTYSNATKYALPWTSILLELKEKTEQKVGSTFNACLLNLYHDGQEGMAYHSDDEVALGDRPTIASLSFGATRKFLFKHKKTKETVSVILETGSLLLMQGETQHNWMHRLPKTKKVHTPRINLTFRTMLPQDDKA